MKIEELKIGRKYLIACTPEKHPEYKEDSGIFYSGEGILLYINPEDYEDGTLYFSLEPPIAEGYFDIEDIVQEILPSNDNDDPTVGFSANRLHPDAQNPREVTFFDEWNKINVPNQYGKSFINHLVPDCTDRDQKVATTIIQWLGSGVGTAFLCDVINESENLRKFIMDRCGGKLTEK